MNRIKFFISVSLLALSACEIVDDQTKINSWEQNLANPAPRANNPVSSNSRHRVLLAVIDTGVDYNHPKLQNNIHYQLSSSGTVLGVGRDFIGQDNWASPYVVRTSTTDWEDKPEARAKAQKREAALYRLLGRAPDLSSFINPRRNNEQEATEGTYHGTHVAGLMTYDREDFGLLVYRVLPHNRKEGDSLGWFHDYMSEFEKNLLAAIDQAASDGAKIVNLSLGYNGKKPTDGSTDGEKDFERAKLFSAKLKATIANYPNMLFVVAAGNDGAWVDGNSRITVPCSVDSPNVLCVSSIDDQGNPSSFTNILLTRADVVFALGENVLSTLPTQMCTASAMQYPFSDDDISETDMQPRIDRIRKECTNIGMGRLSGTSMASPLVAHKAAEIAAIHPELMGANLLKAVLDTAENSSIGILPVKKLKISKPSWYYGLPSGGIANFDSTPETEYFEGIVAH